MKTNPFFFLGDRIVVEKDELNLFDHYTLKRPNEFKLKHIRNFINDYNKILPLSINHFEYEEIKTEEGSRYLPLAKDNWNYWIVESPNKQDINFSLTVGLAKLDLSVLFYGFDIGINNQIGMIANQLTAVNFFLIKENSKRIKSITESDIQELKYIHSLLQAFNSTKDEFDFIYKALLDFLRLKEVGQLTPFKILGYFSILELLLTTYRPKTSNNSTVNGQLQKKITLINNQLEEKIDFKDYFKGPDSLTLEIIIEKLYKYRNDVAHGNKSDFENELQILKNQFDNIFNFLHTLLKKILIKTLENPQLIKDLKEC